MSRDDQLHLLETALTEERDKAQRLADANPHFAYNAGVASGYRLALDFLALYTNREFGQPLDQQRADTQKPELHV